MIPLAALLAVAAMAQPQPPADDPHTAANRGDRHIQRPLADKARPAAPDRQDAQDPANIHLHGWLGSRIDVSTANRLARIDTNRLLEGYRQRPGRQAWDGEHVGKWLHAATLAWSATGDAALRAKIDQTVRDLIACQEADGYLGTYLPKDRWTEWDVWAHKYNMIGLLTYARATGDPAALRACRRMADLLINTFGDGHRDILAAGHHVGMAPTSVLEPMALLYRTTGDPRDLRFCQMILKAWEKPNGPHIVSRLLAGKGVDKVGNAKAYEMLSCLNGALELHRVTGDPKLLDAALAAWQDIVDHRLYPTGASSACELFRPDFDLPNSNNVGETCVTVTWIQLNAQLLRLTGQARFADQIENTALNQLLGAQRPDGAAWGYYVQMEGIKPYSDTLDGHCCLSSGPRGLALLPTLAVTTDADGPVVNLLEQCDASLTLRDGSKVALKVDTSYPADGRIRITVNPAAADTTFTLKVRTPAWATASTTTPNGAQPSPDGYTAWTRAWNPGDTAELNLRLEPRLIPGDHLNAGKAALAFGPLILAADESLLGQPLPRLALASADLASLKVTPEPAPPHRATWPGARIFRVHATLRGGGELEAPFIPFADAGSAGGRYRVYIPLAGSASANLLLAGSESRSRPGNQPGSIIDDDLDSLAVTYDGQNAAEDWFAVTLTAPATASRFVFTHGKNFHDGGWFDTSRGRPLFQVQRTPNGPWETIGSLDDYPATTAAKGDHERLTWSNRQFTLKLAAPITFTAVRIIGTPASGDNPAQAFSSCAELQAFRD